MKKVLHISTECYPAAKSGGLGDVVGALPIYQPEVNIKGSVIIPKYDLPWFTKQSFRSKHKGVIEFNDHDVSFEILKLKEDVLPYTFYCVDIPELFDRPSIYLDIDGNGFKDEPKRNIGFQRAVLQWLIVKKNAFDLLHCHDHQTGLIPFMIKYVPAFKEISKTPTVFTIHNAQYKGLFQWTEQHLLPEYDRQLNGWLDWDNCIHSLAAAVKLADQVTTVSPNYMDEITENSGSLEYLFKSEAYKCQGVLNGIDTNTWNPKTDPFLSNKRTAQWASFKSKNKKELCKKNGLKSKNPLIGFIGRFAIEKGVDLIADAIELILDQDAKVSFVILGSGDKKMEQELLSLESKYPEVVSVLVMYNEQVAHEIYAACDFLMMPSRFEPCGLNQMYAMRYGTIPIVRSTGGLKDTVPDIKENGNGIAYIHNSSEGLADASARSIELFDDKNTFKELRKKIVGLDFSWEQSVKLYAEIYDHIV